MLGDQRVLETGSVQAESSNARQYRVRATWPPKSGRRGIMYGGLGCYNQSDEGEDDNQLYEDARESRDGEVVRLVTVR